MRYKLEDLREEWLVYYSEASPNDIALFNIAFSASLYESFMALKEWQWWNTQKTDLEVFKKNVQRTIVYFCLLPVVSTTSSYSMVESFYRSYSLFENEDLIDTLINPYSQYYDDSREARLALLLAIYENAVGEEPMILLESFKT